MNRQLPRESGTILFLVLVFTVVTSFAIFKAVQMAVLQARSRNQAG